jgi:hypothetical protein
LTVNKAQPQRKIRGSPAGEVQVTAGELSDCPDMGSQAAWAVGWVVTAA